MFQHERVFVTPAEGVKKPLPVPGIGLIPEAGALVRRELHVERLLRSGDLVTDEAKTKAAIAAADKAAEKAAGAAPAPPAATEAGQAVKG